MESSKRRKIDNSIQIDLSNAQIYNILQELNNQFINMNANLQYIHQKISILENNIQQLNTNIVLLQENINNVNNEKNKNNENNFQYEYIS